MFRASWIVLGSSFRKIHQEGMALQFIALHSLHGFIGVVCGCETHEAVAHTEPTGASGILGIRLRIDTGEGESRQALERDLQPVCGCKEVEIFDEEG